MRRCIEFLFVRGPACDHAGLNIPRGVLVVAVGFFPAAVFAGPYSTGLANVNPGAIDPGVPGFVDNAVNPAFVGWATSVASYLPVPKVVDAKWSNPNLTLGPVTGNNFDIVSLGDLTEDQITAGVSPGQITLSFGSGIRNSAGADFAVFENGFGSDNSVFADLAYVEVSSDGVNFAKFPSTSLTPSAVGAFGTVDPTDVHNLAGKHINAFGNSFGTPFDLSDLTGNPLVQNSTVNLNGIRYVRFDDIPGDGSFKDSQGNSIYDAWPTTGSGGFDLEAVGVLNDWLPGDANLDGKVDVTDLGVLASDWQKSADWSGGDFSGDGTVDVTDLGILASHWQDGSQSFQSALAADFGSLPEPAALAALFFASAILFRKGRKYV